MPQNEETNVSRPRIKVKKFPGAGYEHTTATVTYHDDKGKLQKIEFRPYPDSHALATQRRKTMEASDIDGSEAALRPGKASHAMQDDTSDWSETIDGMRILLKQALNSKVELLTKKQEMADNGQTDNLERTTVTFPEDKLPELEAYKRKLEEGNEISYSVVDGGKRKHCGTVVDDVLNIAFRDEPESILVERSTFEKWTTTNPSKVFERAQKASKYQQTGVMPAANPQAGPSLTDIGNVLPSPLRRTWFAALQASHQSTRPNRPVVAIRHSAAAQSPSPRGGFLRFFQPSMRPSSTGSTDNTNARYPR